MKRKDQPSGGSPPSKRVRPEVPAYHLTPTVQENDGSVQWPAPSNQLHRARQIIRDCAKSQKPVLLVPDKDADGLSAAAILRHTLILLGLPEALIRVHLLSKGNSVHSEDERQRMASYAPAFIFVIDHGSRPGPPLVDLKSVTTLIIDHHYATPGDFPEGTEHVTACESPPVATSSLLTYEICKPLHEDVPSRCDWLCIVGTHGDLGNTLKWEPPFPDMRDAFKQYTKKRLNDVVSLVNAPRRTAAYDVRSAWDALGATTADPASVLRNARLAAARADVNAEVERCTHAAPKFSPDGRIAVFRIRSEAQVHPVIATRWAGHLQSKALEIVLVANEGYLPGKVNFSCRVPRCARARDPPVDIIQSLRAYASRPAARSVDDEAPDPAQDQRPLLERLGADFARGHVQASGGIVATDQFEELMELMEIGVKASSKQHDETSPSKSKPKPSEPTQKNTLMSYFAKKN